jgi:uncharacterized membrane protein
MTRLFVHLKTFIFRGILAVIPLALSYYAIRFLYIAVDRKVARPIEKILGTSVPGLGIVLLLLILYLLGLVASNWAGKRVFQAIERVVERIPLIKNIYHLGRQFGTALSIPEKHVFKRAVLVEHFKPGVLSIAFVTGEVRDAKTGEVLLRLFIPTAPNPTTGFMVFVPADRVRELGWSVKDAMNAVISGGIIGPDEIQ